MSKDRLMCKHCANTDMKKMTITEGGKYLYCHMCNVVLWLSVIIQPTSSTSFFYSGTALFLCLCYVTLTTLLGCVFMLVAPNALLFTIVAHTVILLLWFIVWLVNQHSIQHSSAVDAKRNADLLFINQMIQTLLLIQTQSQEQEVKSLCSRLLDLMGSAPYSSSPSVQSIEQTILMLAFEAAANKENAERQIELLKQMQTQIELRSQLLLHKAST